MDVKALFSGFAGEEVVSVFDREIVDIGCSIGGDTLDSLRDDLVLCPLLGGERLRQRDDRVSF